MNSVLQPMRTEPLTAFRTATEIGTATNPRTVPSNKFRTATVLCIELLTELRDTAVPYRAVN